MKYLITGLGNPGPEYIQTRHNIGFLVLDKLADKLAVSFSSVRHGHIAEGRIKNKQVYLLKPNTYMNLSGKAVRYWLGELGIPVENLLIITDDIALPVGKLRLKTKGSDGGHNGLKSINELLGHTSYARLRFGVGNEFAKGRQVDYVLGEWNAEEKESIPARIELAAEAIESFVLAGAERTMSQFNSK